MNKLSRYILPLLMVACLVLPAAGVVSAENAVVLPVTEAAAISELGMPVFTETSCEWDENGSLIRETAADLNGNPAVNTRGFHRADYRYDQSGRLLSEHYYGLNGEPVDVKAGYAWVEFSYDARGHLLTEDRYASNGARAEIAGSFSYRRDEWDGDQQLSSAWYDSKGNLTRPVGGYGRIINEIERRWPSDHHENLSGRGGKSAPGHRRRGTFGQRLY